MATLPARTTDYGQLTTGSFCPAKAHFPADPGFPEGIAVNEGRVYVSGPAQFGNFLQPRVVSNDIESGAQIADYPLHGQNPLAPQTGTGLAFDRDDVLYFGDIQQGVIRIFVEGQGAPQQAIRDSLAGPPDLLFGSFGHAPLAGGHQLSAAQHSRY